MSSSRLPIFFNPAADSWITSQSESTDLVTAFHRKLPGYAPTRLVPLSDIAKELGVAAVYIKEECNRIGVPSFKILGASWGTFRAVAQKLNLPLDSDLAAIKEATKANPITLFAATAGNHGRAVARVGSILGLPVEIFVPAGTHPDTVRFIADEGARVTAISGSYDEAVRTASDEAERQSGILIQDTAWPGYEDIPNWIVAGYTTLLTELTTQLPPHHAHPTHVLAPVGVGSFASAVVSHYKSSSSSSPSIITVEPDTAPCLHASLRASHPVSVPTPFPTILAGLNCGTVSSTAWPLLSAGVAAAATVSDAEAHEACIALAAQGIDAGPCGAATLVGLRRCCGEGDARERLGLGKGAVVVLLGTEGGRGYDVPRAVGVEDVGEVARELVRIESTNLSGGGDGAKGEAEIVRWIAAWLAHRGVETHVVEEVPGRPSVVGVARGTGGGKSLMFNGHVDTVTLAGYEGDPLSGDVVDRKLFGRGAADMKGGLAAAMVALVRCKDARLRGDVVLAAVADEEDLSIGTEQVLRAGWTADAAIVGEPSNLGIVTAHKGFVWLEVDVLGVASHGSRPDLGVDAISKAGYFLVELDRYAKRLEQGSRHPALGPGSVHASMIKGGEEASSYPAKCTITLERRTVPGETAETVRGEVDAILKRLEGDVPGFKYELRVTFKRSTFDIDRAHPFVSLVSQKVEETTGAKPTFLAEPFWTDCALLSDAGIPVVIYGPKGEGLHAKTEWVDLKSVETVAETLTAVAREFCK
ncbi:hypothetical protein BFW01_g629 [Lasiodiplodia theobromae]|nr:hypothetical protein BFW01_g629 [Lasiodiplodia theobromae]